MTTSPSWSERSVPERPAVVLWLHLGGVATRPRQHPLVHLQCAHGTTHARPAGTWDSVRPPRRVWSGSADVVRGLADCRSGGASRCPRTTTRQRPRTRLAPTGWLHGQGAESGAGSHALGEARRDRAARAAVGASSFRWTDEHGRVLHPRGGCTSRPRRLGTPPGLPGVGRCALGARRGGRDGEEGPRHDRHQFAWTGRQGAAAADRASSWQAIPANSPFSVPAANGRPGSRSVATRISPPRCVPRLSACDSWSPVCPRDELVDLAPLVRRPITGA